MGKNSSENLRVDIVISSFLPIIGGAERITLEIARKLMLDGVDVRILTRKRKGLVRRSCLQGVPIFRLGFDLPKPLGSLSFLIHSLCVLVSRMSRGRLIHVQNIDTPLIVGILAHIFIRKKVVVTIHGENKIEDKLKSILGRLRLWFMRKTSVACVAISDCCHRAYVDIGVASDLVYSIPNGVDVTKFYPLSICDREILRETMGYGESAEIVLFVGRLEPVKRVDLLIRVFAKLEDRNQKLIIVGDGSERGNLEDLCDKMALRKRVDFVGESDAIVEYLQLADIFVLCSVNEGLSVALIEAMSCGLCVATPDIPGLLSVVEDRVNGLIFPVSEPIKLEGLLEQLIQCDSLRGALGAAARETIVQRFSLKSVVKAHVEMYMNLSSNS